MIGQKHMSSADPEVSDASALHSVSQGHIGALGVIYDRYHANVFSFVRRATNDASDAEDIVHATFMTAARAAGRYDGRMSCRPWLVGIAARLIHRRKRGLFRWARALQELRVYQGDRLIDPHRELTARDDMKRLSKALEMLTEPKRVVLLLAESSALSSEDIAEVLQIPVGTVWTRLHHARRDLRRLLSTLENS